MAGRFNAMSPRAQALVCLVLAGLLATAGWQTFVRQARAGLAAERAQLSSLEAGIRAARIVAAGLPVIEREVAALDVRLRGVEGHAGEALSLSTLHEIAGDAGLAITSFEAEPRVWRAEYTEQLLALGLEGTYHGLGTFFDRLASTEGLLVVNDLDVRARSTVDGSETLEATCRITVFALDARAGAAPVAATSAAAEPFSPTFGASLLRDPFLGRMPSTALVETAPRRRAPGLAGLAAADVDLRGVARKGQDALAILEGPDGRSYVGRVGARLHDASVIHIATDAVVFATDDGEGGEVQKQMRVTEASP